MAEEGTGYGPLFDSSRAALRFALNYSRTRYAAPLMNKVMAEVKQAEVPVKVKKRRGVAKEVPEPELTKRSRYAPGRPSLVGLDGAAQAGMILLHLAKLERTKQLTVICGTVEARMPCSCKSPCCAGYKFNPEWLDGVQELARLFDAKQSSRRRKDHPLLMRVLIEKHFWPQRRIILSELAETCGVTEATITKHRANLAEFLLEAEKQGWTELDGYLTNAGIVGALS